MPPVRAVLIALVALLPLTVAAGATAQTGAASPQYFTWMAAVGGQGSLFTVVYDSNADDTFVLERDATTGTVRSRFGSGFVAAGIDATREGRVYVATGDGTVRVFVRGASGDVQTATWTIAVPGQRGAVSPTGIARTPNGYTLVALTVEGSQPLGPPAFAGVVLLDSSGATVATWEVPSESLPENAFVLPATLTRAPGGEVFVGGLPCQAGACGGIVTPNGFLYRLAVDTDADGAPAIATAATWQSPDLVAITSAEALDGASLVVAGGGIGADDPSAAPLPRGRTLTASSGGDAYQLGLGGGQVQVTGTLAGTLDPSRVALDIRPSGVTAYLTENTSVSAPVDAVIIERFTAAGSTWTRQGLPWPASWGASGPPTTTCAGTAATIVGTSGADVIRGTPGRDVIAALGGDDRVRGLGGDDLICLGTGDDVAYSGAGEDRVLGGAGADRIDGRGDDDMLIGGAGPDRLLGGGGDDDLRGGAGADLVLGGPGRDLMRGEPGEDVLVGGPGRDRALGGAGADVCVAEARASC